MEKDLIFRKAEITDKLDILKLYHSLIGTKGCTWNLQYPTINNIKDDIENNSLYCLCDYSNNIIAVGFAGVCDELNHIKWNENIKNPCDLARIGVRLDMQGKGIGTLILKYIFIDVKKRGFDGIRMLVSKSNPSALALYNKNGFSCCGEVHMFDINFFCYELVL